MVLFSFTVSPQSCLLSRFFLYKVARQLFLLYSPRPLNSLADVFGGVFWVTAFPTQFVTSLPFFDPFLDRHSPLAAIFLPADSHNPQANLSPVQKNHAARVALSNSCMSSGKSSSKSPFSPEHLVFLPSSRRDFQSSPFFSAVIFFLPTGTATSRFSLLFVNTCTSFP